MILTEGETKVLKSLPQSATLTAPSSDGAKLSRTNTQNYYRGSELVNFYSLQMHTKTQTLTADFPPFFVTEILTANFIL